MNRRPRVAAVAILTGALAAPGSTGCAATPTDAVSTPAAETQTAAAPPRDSTAGAPDPSPSCGPRGERFAAGIEMVPADTPLLALLDLESPDLEPALGQLGTLSTDGRGLPIRATFALSQLGWQVPALRLNLARAGYHPADLAYAQAPGGEPVWLWPSTCDLDRARRAVEDGWNVETRAVTDGVNGTAAEPGFPFDVLFLPADRVALVPQGKATALRSWLTGRKAAGPEPTLRPDDAARDLKPAPVRAILHGHALLHGQETRQFSGPVRLRALPKGLEIGGSVTDRE